MPPLELTYGPILIGVVFNAMLYGMLVVQSFIYYQTYTKDARWIRYFVLYLFVAETLNTGFDIALVYEPLVKEFGATAAMTYFPTMLPTSPILTVLISTPVQMFTAWRICVLSKTWWIGAVITAFALVSLAGGFWTGINVIVLRLLALKAETNTSGIVWFVASAIADFMITASLVYTLATRKTGFARTDSTINRIIRLVIQTGFITSFFAMADLISFCASPHTAMNFAWDFALSKIYSNALLSTLNARLGWDKLKGPGQHEDNVLFGADIVAQSTASNFHPAIEPIRFRPGLTGDTTTSEVYEFKTTKTGEDIQCDPVHVIISQESNIHRDVESKGRDSAA